MDELQNLLNIEEQQFVRVPVQIKHLLFPLLLSLLQANLYHRPVLTIIKDPPMVLHSPRVHAAEDAIEVVFSIISLVFISKSVGNYCTLLSNVIIEWIQSFKDRILRTHLWRHCMCQLHLHRISHGILIPKRPTMLLQIFLLSLCQLYMGPSKVAIGNEKSFHVTHHFWHFTNSSP